MINGLRFIEREVDEGPGKGWTVKRILQQHLGQNGWVDVPMDSDTTTKDDQ